MDPEVVAQLLHRPRPTGSLTPRERDVLRMIAECHSNAAIAVRMAITEKAVSNYINTLFAKLGLPPHQPPPSGPRRARLPRPMNAKLPDGAGSVWICAVCGKPWGHHRHRRRPGGVLGVEDLPHRDGPHRRDAQGLTGRARGVPRRRAARGRSRGGGPGRPAEGLVAPVRRRADLGPASSRRRPPPRSTRTRCRSCPLCCRPRTTVRARYAVAEYIEVLYDRQWPHPASATVPRPRRSSTLDIHAAVIL
jgi:DNA-binding CsgD family transcriptional regulator